MTARKIFIDSSVLIAFIDRGSANHLKASKALEDLASLDYRLYTSSEAITDSYNLLSREVGVSVAIEFLQTMFETSIEILFPQRADLITAKRILGANKDRQISLTEALTATMMQKKGILQIITFGYWNKLFGTSVSNLLEI